LSSDIDGIATPITAQPNTIHIATPDVESVRNHRPNAERNKAAPIFAATAEPTFSFSFARRRSAAVRSILFTA